MKGGLIGGFFLLLLVAIAVYSGWWAREFVYALEHGSPAAACVLEGSCGDR